MRKPRIPPMLTDIVQATLASFDGALFDSAGPCPSCGREPAGYDVKSRQFAVIIENDRKRAINVLTKRFRCRSCGQVFPADQPFYPDTRIGSPVVDLCITLGETMHYPRVSVTLAEMGIVVDRWSVRNYIRNNTRSVPSVEMFNVRVPFSLFSLSSLAMETGEGRSIDPDRLLAACDYPSRKRGLPFQHKPETTRATPDKKGDDTA
ncbi:MAG: hypothetical protein GX651_01105 [Methanomicrobiales archaeon]|nr:hypothetical protein [Methanomicrobiales archaeon]